MSEKTCRKCKRLLPIDCFSTTYQRAFGKSYYASYCKECRASHGRKQYKENRERIIKHVIQYQKNNPNVKNAHVQVRQAVQKGILTRPEYCETCGRKARLQAHHHKGYEKKYSLDVKWLCSSCHHRVHVTRDEVGTKWFGS